MQGRSVTKKTDWFDLREARLQLKSYSQPMMEMAVASARSPTGALQAGKHGIGMISLGGTSDDALKAHAANWGVYEEAARENGKVADRRKWRIVTFAHVAETREQARADMKFGLEDFVRYFAQVATFPIIPPDVTGDPADYLTTSGLACIGTPDDCIRHFERLWKGSNGGLGGIMLLAHNWADWPATLRSYELMARYVHPHFQRNANALARVELQRCGGEIRDSRPADEGAVQAATEKYQARSRNLTRPDGDGRPDLRQLASGSARHVHSLIDRRFLLPNFWASCAQTRARTARGASLCAVIGRSRRWHSP